MQGPKLNTTSLNFQDYFLWWKKAPATYRVSGPFSSLDGPEAGYIYGRHLVTVRRRSVLISWHYVRRQFSAAVPRWVAPGLVAFSLAPRWTLSQCLVNLVNPGWRFE